MTEARPAAGEQATAAAPSETAKAAATAPPETAQAGEAGKTEAAVEAKDSEAAAEKEAERAAAGAETEAGGAGEPGAAGEAAPAPAPAALAATLGTEAADTEPAAAGPVGAAPAAAGGGAAPVPAAVGGEPQGGSEEDGAAELEERLARADPDRAEADEADPADLALGAPVAGEGDEPVEDMAAPELPEPAIEDMAPAPSPDQNLPETSVGEETAADLPPSVLAAAGGAEAFADSESAGAETAEAAPDIEDDATVEGFSGDEPALGATGIEQSEPPDLSDAEQSAALDSIAESTGGGGAPAGGGGGGGAISDKPVPAAPDVSADEPSAALAKIGSLPPVQLKQALAGVNAAVAKAGGDKRAKLAADPPEMERPTGSPVNLHGGKAAEVPAKGEAAGKVDQAAEGADQPTPEPEPLPEPPPSPAEQVRTPAVTGTEGGELSEGDVARMSSSVQGLPTRDPGLDARAGAAPQVELAGNADPAQTDEQRQKLQASVGEAQAQGRTEVAEEMGENTSIFPTVAPETLTATVPQGGGAAGGGAAGGGAGGANEDALSIIAQEEKGGEIQAAAAKARGDMAAKKEEYATKVADEKAKSVEEVAALEAESTTDQARARAEAQAEVRAGK
ncbi:MAG: hypothetical protein V3S45_01075, partial [Kiloniellales bacterium]